MAWNRRDVVIGSSTLIVGEKENRIFPRRAVHKRIHDFCNLGLPGENGLSGTRMLIIVTVACFDESEARERAVREIAKVTGKRSDVIGINTKGARCVSNNARWLGRGRAGRLRWVLIQISIGIGEGRELGGWIVSIRRRSAVIPLEAKVVGDGIVDFPGHVRLIEFLEDARYVELGKVIFIPGVFDQSLGGSSGKGCDAVGNALARDGREPAI